MMTLQEIFNTVYTGLRSQGFQRCTTEFTCQYRHNGMKCAFGHLIPDEQYHPALENRGAFILLSGVALEELKRSISYKEEGQVRDGVQERIDILTKFKEWSDSTFTEENRDLIFQLQKIHDRNTNPVLMNERLKDFAEENNLTIPE